jgi:hypothetical protein
MADHRIITAAEARVFKIDLDRMNDWVLNSHLRAVPAAKSPGFKCEPGAAPICLA